MLREHKIRIIQEEHWAIIKLIDTRESSADGGSVSGTWEHTKESYTGKEIVFSTDNPEHYYYEWRGPHAGTIRIGIKMNSPSSHKQGEEPYFQVLITLNRARRTSMSRYDATLAQNPRGNGSLTYNVNPHFAKGQILYTPEYD